MSPDTEAVGLGPVDQRIGVVEVEVPLRRLGGLPFHAVLGRDLAEVCLQDSLIGVAAELGHLGRRTKVEFALGRDQLMETGVSLPFHDVEVCRGGGDGQSREEL